MTDERTQRTAQHYSARARGFDEHWAPLLRAMSRRVLPALPLRTARAVLDVGTGTGGMLPPLRAAAPSAALFGVDVAEGMAISVEHTAPGPAVDAGGVKSLGGREEPITFRLLPRLRSARRPAGSAPEAADGW